MATFAEAVALGDCEVVVAAPLPDEEPSRTAHALAASRCRRATDPAGALSLLDGAGGVLSGYVAWQRAEAQLVLGSWESLAAELEGVNLPGAAGLRVRLLRATARRDVDTLLALASDQPAARLQAADVLFGQGDRERALGVLRQAWTDARPGRADLAAQARLADLGVDVLAGDDALLEARLASLARANRAEEALDVAERLAARHPPTTAAAWDALGRARYNARHYAEACQAWTHVVGPPDQAVGGPQALFDTALCFARTGDYDTAAVIYRRVMAQHPTTKQADFASFKLGYMEQDRGDCARAVPLFDEHRARYPTSTHTDEALWFTARCAVLAGDTAAAERAWATLEEVAPSSSLVPGAAYWRARSAGGEAATAGYERVLASWPVSAYAWLAAERLGRTFPHRDEAPAPALPAALAARPEVIRAEALAAAGLQTWASAELRAVPKPEDRTGVLALAAAELRAGDAGRARDLACPLAASPWKGGDPVAAQLCHPKVQGAVVEGAAGEVPTSLVYGVMLAESALDPTVSSQVGARGLMQLMPEVARGLHEARWPGRPFDPDQLYVAPYNALLGTSELAARGGTLAGLLRPSSWPAVVGSYNAGEDAVRRWATDGMEDDAWVEAVGYVETRGYVKRVLGYAMEWRWVWGD